MDRDLLKDTIIAVEVWVNTNCYFDMEPQDKAELILRLYGYFLILEAEKNKSEQGEGMKRICSWCGRFLGRKPGPKDQITHSICEQCKKDVLADADVFTTVRKEAIDGKLQADQSGRPDAGNP